MCEWRRPAVGPPLLRMNAGAAWPKPVEGFRCAGDLLPVPWCHQSVGKLVWLPEACEQGCHGHAPHDASEESMGKAGRPDRSRQVATEGMRPRSRQRSGITAGQAKLFLKSLFS